VGTISWAYLGLGLAVSAVAIAALMGVTLALSIRASNFSIIDTFWGLGFVVVAAVCFLVTLGHGDPGRRLIALLVPVVWGLRLAGYIHWRNHGKPEDPRYTAHLRRRTGALVPYAIRTIFWAQGWVMWVVAIPITVAMCENHPINAITWVGEHFIGLFNEAGKQFGGLVTGILPTLIVLLTFMYAVIAFIGEDRVTRAVQWSGRWMITRYTIMPILAVLVLTNPMCYTFGRFLRERHKPAFYDSAVSFVHPVTTFFPYANAGELFVWLGVAAGVTKLGESPVPLAIRYFLVGIVVIFIRGVCTELITGYLIRRENKTELFNEFDAEYAAAAGGAK